MILRVAARCALTLTIALSNSGCGTMLKLAAERPCLKVVDDQRGCPTFAEDLAGMIGNLVAHPAQGILHVTNEGDCTWREFASEIVRLSGLRVPVEPITTADLPRPAKRPAYSVLSSDRLHQLGFRMPAWQDGLQRFVKALSGAASAVR